MGTEQRGIPAVVGHPPQTNSTHLVLQAGNWAENRTACMQRLVILLKPNGLILYCKLEIEHYYKSEEYACSGWSTTNNLDSSSTAS